MVRSDKSVESLDISVYYIVLVEINQAFCGVLELDNDDVSIRLQARRSCAYQLGAICLGMRGDEMNEGPVVHPRRHEVDVTRFVIEETEAR